MSLKTYKHRQQQQQNQKTFQMLSSNGGFVEQSLMNCIYYVKAK